MLTARRNISSILLGFFYGSSFIGGVEKGLEYVLKTDNYVIGQWPAVELLIKVASISLASFLASYNSQSFIYGLIAGLLGTTVLLFLLQETIWLIIFIILALVGCIIASFIGKRFLLDNKDILHGRLFGISWKHWLWLWLPCSYMVANIVWLSYPASILYGHSTSVARIIIDIIKVPSYIVLMCWAMLKAFLSLQDENGLTRTRSAIYFLGWFLLFPIIANILRVFKII